MYIVSVLAVIVISWYLSDAQGVQMWIIDPPTILVMALFAFTILLGSGFLKDFNNALRLGIQKKCGNESANELKRSIEAVCLVRKVLVAAGMFLLFFELTQILMTTDLSEPSASIGYMMATGLKAPVYASMAILVLLPLESTLKMKLWNIQDIRGVQAEVKNQEGQTMQGESESQDAQRE